MELIRQKIQMNRWKGNTTTQVTLDDDFIVPDTMDDMEQVLLDNGEIQIESVKNQGEKVLIKGRLDFQVLTGGRKADFRHWAEAFRLKNRSMCLAWKIGTTSV